MYLEPADNFTAMNLQTFDIGKTNDSTHCIVENADRESTEDGIEASNIASENVDRLKPREFGTEAQILVLENVDEPSEIEIEVANT